MRSMKFVWPALFFFLFITGRPDQAIAIPECRFLSTLPSSLEIFFQLANHNMQDPTTIRAIELFSALPPELKQPFLRMLGEMNTYERDRFLLNMKLSILQSPTGNSPSLTEDAFTFAVNPALLAHQPAGTLN